MNQMPKISIITVVYNSIASIEKTIQSIINQTYKNIEYIIIDGASTDGTIECIKKYESQIAFWSSSKDKGLYDAMNKGLERATGNYVWFINSGDLIFKSETLAEIFKSKTVYSDIYYGETEIIGSNNETIGLRRLKAPENLNWKSFKDGMLICHQSIIIKKNIVAPYSLFYKHAADYEWVLKALKKANTIENTHSIVSKFLDGGQSKKNIANSLLERFRIMSQHYGFFPTVLRHFLIGTKFFSYLFVNKRF